MLFKEALQQYRCYLRKSHFDGKSINEFPVKSPVLNLEDIEWKSLVLHWSCFQDEVLSMKSHDNLNFYFSACALRVFFAGVGFFYGTTSAMANEIGIPFAGVQVLCGGASGGASEVWVRSAGVGPTFSVTGCTANISGAPSDFSSTTTFFKDFAGAPSGSAITLFLFDV